MAEPHPAPWELYERHAALWARQRTADVALERPWLDRFCAGLPEGAAVLDVGCGHGRPVAAELLRRGHRVTGIDRSPSLLDQARAQLPEGRWLVEDLTRFELGETFDGVVAWHSLFHLEPVAQHGVFARLARHLRPGGVALLTTGPAEGSAEGRFGGEVLVHHSLAPATYRTLLAEAGFVVVDHVLDDPRCGHATVWLARLAPTLHP